MLSRSCIASVIAAIVLLVGPAVARADHGFTVSKTEAHAGEEIEFQISGTQAGESYIVKVEDQEVASGFDTDGNGISDKFKMPDFGGADTAVLVEVDITPLGGEPNHRGSQIVNYLAPASSSGGTPTVPPVPIKTVTAPAPVDEPTAAETPPASNKSKPKSKGKSKGKEDNNSNTNTGSGGSSSPTSDPAPAASPSSPTPDSSSVSDQSSTPAGGDSPGLADSIKNQAPPPGPTGPTAPVGGSIAAALSPLSGLAAPGKTGFPILLIVLFVLLAALALIATGPRVWQRFEPALPWGPDADDEIRLTALGRASASSAELQQTIAAKKKLRNVGRSVAGTKMASRMNDLGANGSPSNSPSNGASNGSASNGSAQNGGDEQHSKTPATH